MGETVRSPNHDKKGRFGVGNNANPKGNNQFTSLVPLIKALKRHGKKQKQDFWDMVAHRAWMNDTILIAILKKLLPDVHATEHSLDDGMRRLLAGALDKLSKNE